MCEEADGASLSLRCAVAKERSGGVPAAAQSGSEKMVLTLRLERRSDVLQIPGGMAQPHYARAKVRMLDLTPCG